MLNPSELYIFFGWRILTNSLFIAKVLQLHHSTEHSSTAPQPNAGGA